MNRVFSIMIRSYDFERYVTQSFFSNLNALTKMTMLLAITILLILIDQTEVLLSINLFVVLLLFVSKLSFRLQLIAFGIICLNTYSLVLSQSLFYNLQPRTLFFSLGQVSLGFTTIEFNFWSEGIIYGLKSSLRLNAPFLLSYILFFTTSPHDILNGLKRFRINDGLSIMLLTALRFIPFVFENYQIIRKSERLKGYQFSIFKPVRSLKTELSLFVPVFFSSLRNAKMISISIIGRQVNFKKNAYRQFHPLHRRDRFIISFSLVILGTTLSLKLIFWMYLANFYYSESLRPLYDFTRHFL